ncbi:hypothetical protein ACXJY6_05385 [Vibrio sp. RC27]
MVRERIRVAVKVDEEIVERYTDVLCELLEIEWMGDDISLHLERLEQVRLVSQKLQRLINMPDMKNWADRHGRVPAEYDNTEVNILPSELVNDACSYLDFTAELELTTLDESGKNLKRFYVTRMKMKGIDKKHIHKLCYQFLDFASLDAARKYTDRTLDKYGQFL